MTQANLSEEDIDIERRYGRYDAFAGLDRSNAYSNEMTGEHIEQRRLAYNQGYDAGTEERRKLRERALRRLQPKRRNGRMAV